MRNRKRASSLTLILGFYLLFFLFSGVFLHADTSKIPEDKNPVYAIRDSVLSFFYPVSGSVIGFEDELVKVKLHTDKKLKEGTRLSVLREGKPFYHPVTKELVGKLEVLTGRVEIKKYADGLYLCSVIKGTPQKGDTIRITTSKVRLAFFQDRKADWALSEAFYNSLRDSRRFDLIDAYTTTYEPKELSEIAMARGAEASLMFSTTFRDGVVFLNVRLLWPEDATVFAELQEPVGADLLRGLKEDELISLSIARAKGEAWGTFELSAGKLIAMGDVDGDGKRELIVSDGNNIRIYDYREDLREMWLIKGAPQEEHLSIDVLDINQNGRAEIFVTSMREEDTISSYVLEYNPPDGYRKIWDKAPYFFRVIGKTLLMQAFTRSEIYSGPVYEVVWKDRHYQKGKSINLLSQVNIYGFTFVDWQDKGLPQVLAFDDRGYLNLYDRGGELIWSSKEPYGGFDISFERKTHSIFKPAEKWFVKGRLITKKTQRGQEVIVVKKIPFISTVPGLGYKGAEVYSFWWDGGIMDEGLIIQRLPGTITDYWIEGEDLLLISRGSLSTFLSKIISGEFSRGSIIYYYSLKK